MPSFDKVRRNRCTNIHRIDRTAYYNRVLAWKSVVTGVNFTGVHMRNKTQGKKRTFVSIRRGQLNLSFIILTPPPFWADFEGFGTPVAFFTPVVYEASKSS